MKKHYILLILAGLLNCAFAAHSQNHPTNNTKSYDSKSAVTEINSLYDRIQKGEDLGTLATQYTQDPGSFEKKGVLNKLDLQAMDESFAYYIRKLKPGEVSRPFESVFGWHIARIVEIDQSNQYLIQHILIRYQ
jgi:parvulin-like peptidyl-prolyl isomerase